MSNRSVSPDGNSVYLADLESSKNAIFQFATSGGDKTWGLTFGNFSVGDWMGTPAVSPDGTTIFGVGTEGAVALNSTGTLMWNVTLPGYGSYTPAVSPDSSTVYIAGYNGSASLGYLWAYSAPTGGLLWSANTSCIKSHCGLWTVGLSKDGTAAYLRSAFGDLYTYDAATGESMGCDYVTPESTYGGADNPVVTASGTVFVQYDDVVCALSGCQ